MANIYIQGKEYNNVPSVTFNKVGGGTATYTENGSSTTIVRLDVDASGTYTAPTGTAYSPVVVPSGSAQTPITVITADPTISVNSSGLITASVEASQSVTPTVVSGYVTSGSSGTVSAIGSKTSQLPTQGATTITPSTQSQTAVASGKYTTGAVTVDPIPSQYIIPTGTIGITSNGTVDVSQYASASVSVQGSPLKFGVLRPDAEKVQSYTYDKLLVQNEGITIPAYTTTSTTIKAGAALSPTYTCDLDTYDYYILERFVSYPIYSSSANAKGREEYSITSTLYEVVDIPPSSFVAQSGKEYTSHSTSLTAVGTITRELYWSSGTAVGVYTAASYGVAQVAVAPTISSGVITVSSPNVNIRGHASYLSSTYWGYMTDIRIQYIIEIYRVPKSNTVIDGWNHTSHLEHILDCMNNNNRTLT